MTLVLCSIRQQFPQDPMSIYIISLIGPSGFVLDVINTYSTRIEKKLTTQVAVNSVASWGLFVYED